MRFCFASVGVWWRVWVHKSVLSGYGGFHSFLLDIYLDIYLPSFLDLSEVLYCWPFGGEELDWEEGAAVGDEGNGTSIGTSFHQTE